LTRKRSTEEVIVEMTRARKLVIVGAAVIALAAGGVGIAQAVGGDDEEQVTGAQAERAKQAAVESVGGGSAVAVERDDDGGAAYEVEVVRADGREVEVRLTEDLKQVGAGTGDDGDGNETEGANEDR
jgi:uncharacterized membrane protein YkoI